MPEADRLPGYPAFLAAVFTVFGDDVLPASIIQALLSVVTVFLAFAIARRTWGVTVGLVAAALVGFDPYQIRMADWLVTECLATLTLLAIVAIGYRLFGRKSGPSVGLAAALGLTIAIASLIRPTTYYLPIVAVLFLLIPSRNYRWSRVLAPVAALLVPVVLIAGLWQYRNHEDLGTWRYSPLDGANAYYYRVAGTIAQRDGISRRTAARQLKQKIEGLSTLPKFTPIMWTTPKGWRVGPWRDHLFDRGVEIVTENPVPAAIMTARSLAFEFADRGIGSSMSLRKYLPNGTTTLANAAFALGLLVFYVLVAYGIFVVLRRRRQLRAHLFALAIPAYVLLASAGPEGSARFRASVTPILSLFAAVAIVTLARRIAASCAKASHPEIAPAWP